MKVFVTSCVNDFKDVKGDAAAGILTLPVCLGETTTKKVLILILLGLHCVMAYALLAGMIKDEWLILSFGLIITIAFLIVYSSSFETKPRLVYRKLRECVISSEIALFPWHSGHASLSNQLTQFFPTLLRNTRKCVLPTGEQKDRN